MGDFLEKVVAVKRRESAELRRGSGERPCECADRRSFEEALRRPGLSVIAEVKRQSPSRGLLRAELCAAAVARDYEAHGAACLSVLTDRTFFGGSARDLIEARHSVALPVLRKDFLIDPSQVRESAEMGADAVLLIARILDRARLTEMLAASTELRLDCLVEVHSEAELDDALETGARIIGVNSRDLDSFEVDLARGLRLRRRIPPDRLAVAESGIRNRNDVLTVDQAGFDAMLVGEALVIADDPGARLSVMLGTA